MNANNDRLLIVDDEAHVRKFLATVGRKLDFDVVTAPNLEEMKRQLVCFSPTAILLDLQMHGTDGVQALRVLDNVQCEAQIILISGLDTRTLSTTSQLGEVLGLKMAGVLQKPILFETLRNKLQTVKQSFSSIDAAEIESAIINAEIQPAFQPKLVRGDNGIWTISEVEALARWYKPDGTVIPPNDFICKAEESGLLPLLTDSMIRQVAAQLRRWEKNKVNVRAAVNVSPSSLIDTKFPDQVEAILADEELDNSRLAFEITETAAMQNTELAMEILSRLRIKGFCLAVDDFGTGYSSLEQLYRMPFNELKIDNSLISECHNSPDARTVVDAILSLGHKLGLAVCGEGVETARVFEYLLAAGFDKIQGYYVGRPQPAKKLKSCKKSWDKQRIGDGKDGARSAASVARPEFTPAATPLLQFE